MGTSPKVQSKVLEPKQTLLPGLELPSEVEHPATGMGKERPGSVPTSLGQLGHLELLQVGKVQAEDQSSLTDHKVGVAVRSPRSGDMSLGHGQPVGAAQHWPWGCFGTVRAQAVGTGTFQAARGEALLGGRVSGSSGWCKQQGRVTLLCLALAWTCGWTQAGISSATPGSSP